MFCFFFLNILQSKYAFFSFSGKERKRRGIRTTIRTDNETKIILKRFFYEASFTSNACLQK